MDDMLLVAIFLGSMLVTGILAGYLPGAIHEAIRRRRRRKEVSKWAQMHAAPMEVDEGGNLYPVEEKSKPITKASRWRKWGDEK